MKHNLMRILLVISIVLLGSILSAQDKSAKNDLDINIQKAVKLRTNGSALKAVEILKKVVVANPNSDRAYLELGKTWSEIAGAASQKSDMMAAMDGVKKGFDALDKAIEINPNNVEARIYYGIFAVNVPSFFGKTETGIKNLEYSLKLVKNDPETEVTILQFLGKGYRMTSRFDKAADVWERALKLNPPEKTAGFIRKNLNEIYAKLKTSKKKKTVETTGSTDNIDELIKITEKNLEKGNLKKAEESALKALKIDDKRADVHFLLAKIYQQDAAEGYDQRIYNNTDTRSNLAFKLTEHLETAHKLAPDNNEISVYYATAAVVMPFFVGKMDEGISLLESLKERTDINDTLRANILYMLGYAYRKKGDAVWMGLVKNYPDADEVQNVYKEFGLRKTVHAADKELKHRVNISFHLGFQDELSPQTAVWVEDGNGNFVRTVYVSGFAGYAKEKQVDLPIWANKSKFETNGTTGASIDWGKHTFVWDLTDANKQKVKSGKYTVVVESSWWPSMKYARAEAVISVGRKKNQVLSNNKPFIPWLFVEYK